MKSNISLLLTLLLLLAAPFSVSTQAGESATPEPARSETWRTFENLYNTIRQAEREREAMRGQLNAAKADAERERIRGEIALLESNIESLRLAWEMWATGGVDLQMFYPKKEEKFDWREEMQSAFEPIVVELKRLTERPRKMERQRSEQSFYQQRLTAAQAALDNIATLQRDAPSEEMRAAFGAMESRWRMRHDEYKNQLTLINLRLEDLSAPSRPTPESTSDALQELLSGHFVNLLLAVLAAALTYGALRTISRFYTRMVAARGRKRAFLARVAHLSYAVISAVLALLAGMAVLYMRGDWILLGLLLIVLMGAALTLQRTLPGYIKEAKILLNLGPAREGERVTYNGLPWTVTSLNMYSTLVNPALRGGTIKLPVSELTTLISRRAHADEPWFPTRESDFVLLNDGRYGQVLLQTPEVVQMRVLGALISFPVAAFLDLHPQNLSLNGFRVSTQFGIDYRHQADVTGEIRNRLEAFIASHLKESRYGMHLLNSAVEFDEAAASSLNFLIWASFAGAAADQYYPIRRLLQHLAVDACNANDWTIPFSQMTVHLANNSSTKSGDGGKLR